MNREEFFDMFSINIRNTSYAYKDECDFCKNQIGRCLFVKKYEDQETWNHVCFECFCDRERDFYIEISTNEIDLIEIEGNNND